MLTMKNLLKNLKFEIFPISLILILAFSRLIPHPPNFTPLIAAAMLSSYFFKNTYMSLFVLVISMILSDLIIGFYSSYFLVYFSLIVIIVAFSKMNKNINFKNLFLYGISSSLIFFIITNFGVWAFGSLYEKNLTGLISCYILAIPFFTNTVLSTVFYSYTAFFLYSLNIKKTI
jgi:hypothetical protein